MKLTFLNVNQLYQTRNTAFHPISKQRKKTKTRRVWGIFDEIRCGWISDETLSRVLIYQFSIETKTNQ